MISEEKTFDFSAYLVSITDTFKEPEPLIRQGDKVLLSVGNIATIIGKPKAFKTFLTSSIVAAFLESDTLTMNGVGGHCLFVDTEQSRSHVNKVQDRIYRLSDWETTKVNDKLFMLAVRELDSGNRMKVMLEAIDKLKPNLIIIDGIRDLVKDFNDLKESAEIVGQLMSISTVYKCGIITVLHQNKADSNARGHLGSELSNKSETVLSVVNEKGIATVSPVYSRNREIEPFSFYVCKETSLPVICGAPKIEQKKDEVADLMAKAMLGRAWIDKKELEVKIMKIINKSAKTAQRRIDNAIEMGVIKYNSIGSIVLTSQIEQNETGLPF